ncbi:MAG: arginine--tRNA ligase [bacterium]
MNTLVRVKSELLTRLQNLFDLDASLMSGLEVMRENLDKDSTFGDFSCNGALVLAKLLKQNPKVLAQQIQENFEKLTLDNIGPVFASVTVANPGFVNMMLTSKVWQIIAQELFTQKEAYFKRNETERKLRYLIEFVSGNPTGPLHLGAGRNGIIGDVLARVSRFVGHDVHTEYYVNDAGNQVLKLGESFFVRCKQELGLDAILPEDGYVGDYLIELAKICVAEHGKSLLEKDISFFIEYAIEHMLVMIKTDLQSYGITFDDWVSEKKLHENGSVAQAIELLAQKDLVYEKDSALWFKATQFGDEKDRVIKKSTGEMTYVAGDIAYHKDKFDRGYDKIIDILGQDHHGYIKRLKSTMEALGFDAQKLDVIMYQLVSIKDNGELVKMSKRAGTFTSLHDIIETVGSDVARFFYLNRKAEAHLEFDLAVALKKTQENPVYYIQYAYVRTHSLFEKASEFDALKKYVVQLKTGKIQDLEKIVENFGSEEVAVLRKIVALHDLLRVIVSTYQTHLIAYYSWELAHTFHTFYTNNRVLDEKNIPATQARLLLVALVHNTLDICLNLLGVSCPEKM